VGYVPPQGKGLSWGGIKSKLETEGSLNKKYDADLDSKIDEGVLPAVILRYWWIWIGCAF